MLLKLVFLFILINLLGHIQSPGVHQCVHVVTKLAKYGDGSTVGSCMGCDPAVPYCDLLCKPIVQKLFYQCKGICLPDGYFFDPSNTLNGCWNDNVEEIKVQVGRCGCSASSKIYTMSILSFLLVIVITFLSFH